MTETSRSQMIQEQISQINWELVTDQATWVIVESGKLPKTHTELARVLDHCGRIKG